MSDNENLIRRARETAHFSEDGQLLIDLAAALEDALGELTIRVDVSET